MLNQLVLSVAEVHNKMISNIIVVTGSFVLLLVLLKHYAWDSIAQILKKREEKIANDIDSAEQARVNAAKYEKETEKRLSTSRKEAAEIIERAKVTGETSRQAILTEAEHEVLSIKGKAKKDIALEREQAMKSVKDDVAALSLEIAEKILTQELSTNAHEALINQYIEGLGSEYGNQ